MRRIATFAFAIAIVAAGCAKQEGTTVASPPESESPAASAPVALTGQVNNHGSKTLTAMSAELELEQDNFYFEPTFIKADQGGHVTVMLKNEGSVPHTFTIDSLKIDQTVQPDKEAKVTVNLPSGTTPVTFYCKFHKSQGMQGAFYFK